MDQAAGEFESLLEERGIQLAVQVVGPLPPVRADRARVLQVLRNLVSNAAKFTPAGKSIEISSEWDARCVRLGVRDEGTGIPEGELEAVFGEFVQSSTTNASTGGTGLGLALCREIVLAHGGRIWAENRPLGGTSLLVELPRTDAAESPGSDEEHTTESPPEAQAAA